MSVSLEPVDVPTVESETTPTPTQIEAPEGIPIVWAKTKNSVAAQSNSIIHPEGDASITAQQITDEAPEEPPVAIESESKPILPEPKRRGRPKKEVPKEPKTPKAAPKKAVRIKPPSPVVNESSSEEETPLTRDDMETLLLDYLVKRKQSQQQARRTMWSQLAGLS